MLRVLPIASILLFVASCATSSDARAAGADLARLPESSIARVSVRDYRSGMYLALLSGTDADRVEYYSRRRDDAATKIQSPEILEGMIELFDRQGLAGLAQDGPAPAVESAGTKAVEIRQGEEVRHIVRRPEMTVQQALAFEEYVRAFLAVYSEHTYALQAVEGQGEEFRLEPVRSSKD